MTRSPLMLTRVSITAVERSSGTLEPAKLAAALAAMRADGIVVLGDAIEPSGIDALREAMLADMAADDQPPALRRLALAQQQDVGLSAAVAEQATDGPALPDSFYGWGSLRPPPRQPHLFRDIVYNELAIAVSCGYLGDGSRPTLTTCELELLRTLGLIDTVRCVCHMF